MTSDFLLAVSGALLLSTSLAWQKRKKGSWTWPSNLPVARLIILTGRRIPPGHGNCDAE